MSSGWREQQQQHPPCERLAPPPAAPRTAALSLLDLPEAGGEQPPAPQLPEALVLAILARLPPDAQAWGGKLVCRSAAATLRGRRRIRARSAELPLWALQQMFQRCTPHWLHSQLLAARALAGDLSGAAWLAEQGCPVTHEACTMAAEAGDVASLAALRSRRPPWPWAAETCEAAARSGALAALAFLRTQRPPCPLSAAACEAAAGGGHTVVLEWLRQHDCMPWGADACLRYYEAAAANGRLPTLQWLRAQRAPCPQWRQRCRTAASRARHRHVLAWLEEAPD